MENSNNSEDKDVIAIKNISEKISNLLNEIVNSNDYKTLHKNDVFASKKPPKIEILYYIKRIIKYSSIENSTLIISLIYIDRLCSQSNITLTLCNIHKILFACCLVAIKYNEDTIYDNKYYSQIAGISLKETNMLEYSCISLMNFDLFIDESIFDKYLTYIQDMQ